MADEGGKDERTDRERAEGERAPNERDERPNDERWEAEARSTGPRENTDGVTQADAGLQGAEGTARPTDETPVEPGRTSGGSGEEEEEEDDEGDRDPA